MLPLPLGDGWGEGRAATGAQKREGLFFFFSAPLKPSP